MPSADDVLHAIGQSLDDDKAQDVVVIDLFEKSSLADYMVIASGTSKRHLGSMADHVVEKVKEAGASPVAVEGVGSEDWVLIDAGDVIVHLFRPEARSFYALERLWGGPAPVQAATAHGGAGIVA